MISLYSCPLYCMKRGLSQTSALRLLSQELVDACERGNVSEVESLLDQAVDVNSKDLVGCLTYLVQVLYL